MNITPALPNPYQPPAQQDKTAVSAVRATNRTRDPADDAEARQRRPAAVEPAERERLAATLQRQPAGSRHAQRALAAYAEVAEERQRNDLRELLGFDARA